MGKVGRPPVDPARQAERAHRILDAAAELILRWGYDKTTIDDVARRAEVSKGTIYLHWRTRDDLFAALLRRERVHMVAEVRRREPATPSALFGEVTRAMSRRPLLRAVLSGDSEVLGKLTRQKLRGGGGLAADEVLDGYLAELIRLGAVREEPGDHARVINSIVYGFLMLPGAASLSSDRIADLVADTVERVMSPGREPSAEQAAAVARATLGFVDALEELARRKLADSLGSKERAK
ncbi:TetR/AcrR family transcriptional regulator [Nonomuraea jiangxiensis]|uniref:DNA-binding transcriptional regulator, AcrR family n=1 Tax=Nonomuraea jiangxiensis TaxID=633440 RepID=A0A1G7YYQ1_9ACTN|nr:TetR/AcrR family transcriptional regulator [Nonomuraea jiangxiensis]SDH01682.1 DNA-binding transcriptional regulator, AcrR family [Nonomuraea jiangxiensis]